ncbi:MAG: RDD family protein [Fuerstiella sp.]
MSAKQKVDTRVTVETPEGVDFQFMIAGPGKRGMSFFIDAIIKVGFGVLAFLVFAFASGVSGSVSGVAGGAMLFIWFLMSWLYGSCFEAFWHGQTPGKKSQNLRVVRTNGTPIGWFEAFGRNLLLVPDGMLVLGPIALNTVGLASMAATSRMQRLGDLVFDTMVIDETREFISRTPGVIHGIERIPRAHCVGRFHVPERTLAVIERLFEGDRLISAGRREEIARTLAVPLKKHLGYDDGGPDAANPNAYFVRTPTQHTDFLKRILKTFAEDSAGTDEQSVKVDVKAVLEESRRTTMNAVLARRAEANRVAGEPSDNVALEDSTVADEFESLEFVEEVDESTNGGHPEDWRSKL